MVSASCARPTPAKPTATAAARMDLNFIDCQPPFRLRCYASTQGTKVPQRALGLPVHGNTACVCCRPRLESAARKDRCVLSDNPDPAILVENVSKRYGRTLALDGVSMDVAPGQLFALLGPNGAGKTTLVHILSTILTPDSGRALLAGFNVVRQPLKARRSLGVVFQEPSLDDRLTVFENLEFHGQVYGVPRAKRRQRIRELLEVVELTDWQGSLVRQLSGGMKRRLEIARALVHDARILFLDEPTVGLDAQSRARI